MRKRSARGIEDARDIAAEVVRRALAAQQPGAAPGAAPKRMYVVCMGDPPSPAERLQLLAARLLGNPVAIMPRRCATVEEWLERYGHSR